MKRMTIAFDDVIEEIIEDWRAEQRPIPSFTDAVLELCKIGAEKSVETK